ncbi:hypothetical protein CRENPOLYSF1_1480004 [Crenothrix polyspora]|uniref:Uncharacterized protein n=1 Tax=Crenothrix polyspora TaxID=360316 RepID=A0A1R4H344_9GAMM|nr:hypothetical protein CRENPOLYSF1_1480004 [Crenothrix polyspora]
MPPPLAKSHQGNTTKPFEIPKNIKFQFFGEQIWQQKTIFLTTPPPQAR